LLHVIADDMMNPLPLLALRGIIKFLLLINYI